MYPITKQSIQLTKKNIDLLARIGVRVPPKSKTCDYTGVLAKDSLIDTYAFKNANGQLLKSLKQITDKNTNEQTIQLRYYKYLGECSKNRKLSGINQYSFSATNRCVDSQSWHFYHTGKSGEVYYSHISQAGNKDNFIKVDEAYVDNKGFKIIPVSTAEFLSKKQNLGRKKFVDAPWTIKESITADKVVTDSVQECTVVGFVGDRGVSLNHFNPNNSENYDTDKLEKFMKTQINLQGRNVKAFVLGSCESDAKSNEQFNSIIDFLAVNKIPFSSYKTGDKVLYIDFDNARSIKGLKFGKQVKEGLITPEYRHVGQNLIYNGNNEILLNNTIIDKELRKGNYNSKALIKKSFSKIG